MGNNDNSNSATEYTDADEDNEFIGKIKKMNTGALTKALEKADLSKEGARADLVSRLVQHKEQNYKQENTVGAKQI